jgi:transcriptional regulator with GAF, ATPase, and Fis domain
VSTGVESSIAMRLAELVREIDGRFDTAAEAVLDELATSTVALLPGAQYCGITTATRDGTVQTVGRTHRYAVVLDEIQHRRQEGPCLSAAWNQHTVTVSDLDRDERWPKFREDAVATTPVRSVLSFQLFTSRKQVGALSFYAERPAAFDDDAVEEGLILAAHTAIAWHVLLRDKQFRSALASRDVIGQAKGIIMERFDVDAVRAFELLKRLSQDTNTPLVAVAGRLVKTEHPARSAR